MVKGGLIVFVGLFVFLTLISLLIPSRIVTTRAETVQADSLRLYSEIADLKNALVPAQTKIDDAQTTIDDLEKHAKGIPLTEDIIKDPAAHHAEEQIAAIRRAFAWRCKEVPGIYNAVSCRRSSFVGRESSFE